MFSAKLIDSPAYYILHRRWAYLTFILFAIPTPFILMLNAYPWWLTGLAVLAEALLIWLIINNARSLQATISQRKLLLDEHSLRITGSGGKTEREIDLHRVDAITIPSTLRIPDETMSQIADKLKGHATKNAVVIRQDASTERFEFVLESHYMIRRMEELVKRWRERGIEVEQSECYIF